MKFFCRGLALFLWAKLVVSSCILAGDVKEKNDAWTWLYYRTFDQKELEEHKEKAHMFFVKEDLPLFTQLIFSWNAQRPAKGHFSFWVRARDAKSKQWSSWHHMIDWGADKQRSYRRKSDGVASYNHARLEMNSGILADAFYIKVAAHEGASLPLFKACGVSISNLQNFKNQNVNQHITSLPSVHLRDVPALSQFEINHPKNRFMCSPTSCSMLISYFMNNKIDPLAFALKSFDSNLDTYGNWPFNMASAFEICNGSHLFFTSRLNSFEALHERLQRGMPVVVSVRGQVEGGHHVYKYGHLLMVSGWDAKKQEVIVHDPAFSPDRETVRRYPLKSFLDAWDRSHRLAYLAEVNS